jgi:regulator of protease activity HflC (stomatin/prohibitin superfamily)
MSLSMSLLAPPLRLLRGLTLGLGMLALLLAALQLHAVEVVAATMMGELSAAEQPAPLLAELARSHILALPLAALLPAVAGLGAAWLLAWARECVARAAPARRWRRLEWLPEGSPRFIGQMLRWPQAVLIVPLAALACAAAFWLQGTTAGAVEEARAAWMLGGALIALGFPLLVGERMLAALPDAAGLRALVFLPMLALPASGLLELAASAGLTTPAAWAARALALLPAMVAIELAGRAAGRCFLPPPSATTARSVDSVLARLVADGAAERGVVAPVRQHFGIDFARSWALAFVRGAFAPLALLLLLLGVGLSGVALVPLDQRAVYERFGAPVRVLPPGLHLILPWPFGRLRAVEVGQMHELALTGDSALEQFGAEDVPPFSADRLWEQENPAETWFLVASAHDGQQGFQMVSADIRLFWRVGLADADALRATYAAADPVALFREAARRGAANFFAGRTLDAVLGENRETMASRLRAAVQHELEGTDMGLELDSVIIEALHPPGGAADAYHAVQAAQIDAQASIFAERGRAFASLSEQRQAATGLLRGAVGAASETVSAARAEAAIFAADHDADRAGAPPFRMEQRLAALRTALSGANWTLLDHRIPPAEAVVLDFRPQPGAPTTGGIGK